MFHADGLFLKRVKGTDNSADNKTLVDERPSSGTGPKSMQLINHFTFDGSDLMNVAPSNSLKPPMVA